MIYYDNNCRKVMSTYLDYIEIEKCGAENIVLAHRSFLSLHKFDVKNLVMICSDLFLLFWSPSIMDDDDFPFNVEGGFCCD